MPQYSQPEDLHRILSEARTIAVLGAHPDTSRPASYVPAYLHQSGYRVLPVNPAKLAVRASERWLAVKRPTASSVLRLSSSRTATSSASLRVSTGSTTQR